MPLLQLAIIMYLCICMILFPVLRYLQKREQEQINFGMRLVITAAISLLVFIPCFGIVLAMLGLFEFASFVQFIQFSHLSNAIIYVLAIVICIYFVETLGFPILWGWLSHYVLKHSFQWFKPLLVVIVNTCAIYVVSEFIPGVLISGWLGALGVALLFQIVEQVWNYFRTSKSYKQKE
ncbi:hypothetical protein [Paenibacillus sp. WLX2291]|uniref:hypothetical protein n=1 Tax=Paenibacillus sp. WLX2291 TaxID=3296934 RepID=UPI0039845549